MTTTICRNVPLDIIENSNKYRKRKMSRRVSIHKAGHSVIGYLVPSFDMNIKVGLSSDYEDGIWTFDECMVDSDYIHNTIMVDIGGYVCEKIFYGDDISVDAVNDYHNVCKIGYNLVEDSGVIAFSSIIGENNAMIGKYYDEVFDLLTENISIVLGVSEALLENEYLEASQINTVFKKYDLNDLFS